MTMPALTLKITSLGLQRFTAAQAGGDVDLTISSIGLTPSAFVAAPTLTALPGEVRRVTTVSGEQVGDNVVHLVLRDQEMIAYTVRGLGLYLADGTLFAVYGQPTPIVEKSAQSTLWAALDIVFPTGDATMLSFGDATFLNPPATSQTMGVARLATMAEVDAGTAPDLIVTPKTLSGRLAELVAALMASIADTVADYIPLAQRGHAGGVAQLDQASKVPLAQIPVSAFLPAGTIALFFGIAAPAGWAICDGTVADLADGSGTITTPDLRGRVAVGLDGEHALGVAFGGMTSEVTVQSATTGVTLSYSTDGGYAGGGSQVAVAAGHNGAPPALTDPGHAHEATVDVRQPSMALLYIIKL